MSKDCMPLTGLSVASLSYETMTKITKNKTVILKPSNEGIGCTKNKNTVVPDSYKKNQKTEQQVYHFNFSVVRILMSFQYRFVSSDSS